MIVLHLIFILFFILIGFNVYIVSFFINFYIITFLFLTPIRMFKYFLQVFLITKTVLIIKINPCLFIVEILSAFFSFICLILILFIIFILRKDKCLNKSISNLYLSVFLFAFFLTVLLFIIILIIIDFFSWLYSSKLSLLEDHVIFYFIKYDFDWFAMVFWSNIASNWMFVVALLFSVLLLGEHDPYFIEKAKQGILWFTTEYERDWFDVLSLFYTPFRIIRESFTVSGSYDFDPKRISKWGFLYVLFMIFNLFLFSFLSLWIHKVYCKFLISFPISILLGFKYYLLKVVLYYLLFLLIILNLFLVFSFVIIIITLLVFIVEAWLIYTFNLPNEKDYSLEAQEELIDGHNLALFSIEQKHKVLNFPFFYNYSPYLRMMPQGLCIVLSSSTLMYFYQGSSDKSYIFSFLIKDLYTFFNKYNLLKIHLEVCRMCSILDSIINSHANYSTDYLVLLKFFLIYSNPHSYRMVKDLISLLNYFEFFYVIGYDIYDINILNSYLYCPFLINFNRATFFSYSYLPLVNKEEICLENSHFKVCSNSYQLSFKDIYKVKLLSLNSIFRVFRFIKEDIVNRNSLSSKYLINGFRIHISFTGFILNFKFFNNTFNLNSKIIVWEDSFDKNLKDMYLYFLVSNK